MDWRLAGLVDIGLTLRRLNVGRGFVGRGRGALSCALPLMVAGWLFAEHGAAAEAVQPFRFNLPAPPLVGGEREWLNTSGRKLQFEQGQVYVVHFWTFGCINCQRNLPCYARWQKRFGDRKVTIIGVHTPETDAEKQTENVIRKVREMAIAYPVLLDQAGYNWARWQQQVWPTAYLVDKKGRGRFRWSGELDWQGAGGEEKMARCIEALLREP